MMQKSESIAALAAALAQANLEMANPTFDKKNSHFNNGYASLAAVLNAIRQPLAKQGLSLVQTISTEPGSVIITTSLLHKSGEWLSAVPQNATAQALGSATSYMRRYSALSLCGIAGEDDDAEEDRRDREERRPMAVPTKRQPFRPQEAKGAPVVAEKVEMPVAPPAQGSGVADSYPDEYEGEFKILRVSSRAGKPHAIHADGQHGKVWIATTVGEYAEMARAASVNNKPMRLHLDRVGQTLEVMRVIAKAEEVVP
jgi:hypothetical protein